MAQKWPFWAPIWPGIPGRQASTIGIWEGPGGPKRVNPGNGRFWPSGTSQIPPWSPSQLASQASGGPKMAIFGPKRGQNGPKVAKMACFLGVLEGVLGPPARRPKMAQNGPK